MNPTKVCKKCGLTIRGVSIPSNPYRYVWSHPQLKACTKRKPIKDPTQ